MQIRPTNLDCAFFGARVCAAVPYHLHFSDWLVLMIRRTTLRVELGPTLRLALPLVLAELGWMSMAIVDTMMVGRLGNSAVAMGAVSLGSAVFMVLALFGEGLLLGLDTLVAQAFGAGQREDCHRSLVNGVYLSIALTPILSAPIFFLPRLLRTAHVDAGVA